MNICNQHLHKNNDSKKSMGYIDCIILYLYPFIKDSLREKISDNTQENNTQWSLQEQYYDNNTVQHVTNINPDSFHRDIIEILAQHDKRIKAPAKNYVFLFCKIYLLITESNDRIKKFIKNSWKAAMYIHNDKAKNTYIKDLEYFLNKNNNYNYNEDNVLEKFTKYLNFRSKTQVNSEKDRNWVIKDYKNIPIPEISEYISNSFNN